jgi:hypothetical protein
LALVLMEVMAAPGSNQERAESGGVTSVQFAKHSEKSSDGCNVLRAVERLDLERPLQFESERPVIVSSQHAIRQLTGRSWGKRAQTDDVGAEQRAAGGT